MLGLGAFISKRRLQFKFVVDGIACSLFLPLLLQTDQVSKLNNYDNAPLLLINLNHYKSLMKRMSKIALKLSSVSSKTSSSYILFCLPKVTTTSKIFLKMFREHLRKEIPNLVTIDERIYFFKFRLCFQNNFLTLKDALVTSIMFNEIGNLFVWYI